MDSSSPFQPYLSSRDLGREKSKQNEPSQKRNNFLLHDHQNVTGNWIFKYFCLILEILGFKAPWIMYGGGRGDL